MWRWRTKRNLHLASRLFRWGSRAARRKSVRRSEFAWDPNMAMMKATDTVTVIKGYDAVRVFLETVWRRHDQPVEEIAFVLGALKWADGSPVDPTMWQDWLAAVQISASAGPGEIAAGRSPRCQGVRAR